MTKYILAPAFALLLVLGIGCDSGGDDGDPDSGTDFDAGNDVDAGPDAGPVCTPPTDGVSATFFNRGACADSRVECESFDNTRIPTQP